jgi:hypothetical protein
MVYRFVTCWSKGTKHLSRARDMIKDRFGEEIALRLEIREHPEYPSIEQMVYRCDGTDPDTLPALDSWWIARLGQAISDFCNFYEVGYQDGVEDERCLKHKS